jgi:hypothetical protein
MFFTFPEDARWNAERQDVEFGVEIGEYRGVVRARRRVFQRLLAATPQHGGECRPRIRSVPHQRPWPPAAARPSPRRHTPPTRRLAAGRR